MNKQAILVMMVFAALFGVALPSQGWSQGQVSTTGVSGYDLVSFHTGEKPLRGNGNHLSVVEGVTYLFVNEENKEAFDANPGKYLPAFGGYCAYGVAVGKKFVGDPDVWRIVDGKLYLNLDTKIQGMWLEDIAGNIVKANKNWNDIKDIPADKL